MTLSTEENVATGERLPDESERATSIEMAFTASAVASARKAAKQDQLPGPGGKYAVTECEECGDEIGEGRLRAASRNLLCIVCATKEERRKRGLF